ncbi:MAG: acyl-CoA dehydrogenase, partial [Comamonadaceae bacterium]
MDFVSRLDTVIAGTLEELAPVTDRQAAFPRAAIRALGAEGLLGLVSSKEVGGAGLGLAEASQVVKRLAQTCPSTAMIVCMHYCAVAVIEQMGPVDVRQAIAAGRHLGTLAFSEAASRSHFWAPAGTARR